MRVSARQAACEFLAVQRDMTNPMTDSDEDCSRRLRAFSDGLVASMFAQMLQEARRHPEPVADRQAYVHAMSALDEAKAALPDRDRKLIELHYFQNRDLKEVAKELGVSYATVRRYHGSVMERLAVRLRARGVTESPAVEGSP